MFRPVNTWVFASTHRNISNWNWISGPLWPVLSVWLLPVRHDSAAPSEPPPAPCCSPPALPRDLSRPIIGMANTWTEIGPCNYHLRELAAAVKAGIRAAGGTPMEFNTVSISDGITMGTEGMRASLVSREVIADSIELVARGNGFDGLVVLVGCDKTIPGRGDGARAARHARAWSTTAARSRPGKWHGKDVTIQDVFEAVGAARGRHDERRPLRARRGRLSRRRCLRRPVHGQHDGAGARVPRPRAARLRRRAGDRARSAGSRGSHRRAGARGRHGEAAAAAALDAPGLRQRDPIGRGDGRIDQRGPAPAGDRPRSRRAAGAG